MEFRLNYLTSYSYDDFEIKFLKKLNRHAPLKNRILQHNGNRFMMKELRKAIILRSKLKNIFNKDKTHFNWQKHKDKQHFCLNLLKDKKKKKKKNSKILSNSFKFEPVTKDHIKNEIHKFNIIKLSTFACVPVTILKDCVDAYLVHLTNSLDYSWQTSVFPQKLKQEVIPL